MKQLYKEQLLPIVLTGATFALLWAVLHVFIVALNNFTTEDISLVVRKRDVLVGLTIYLKTSVDFGIFIGNLMRSNAGWKKRIAIELGTAVGNGLGTLVVLIIWNFFREVPLLMAFMIMIASLVLLRMAQESLVEFCESKTLLLKPLKKTTHVLSIVLMKVNEFFAPILRKIVPSVGLTKIKPMSWIALAFFSFSIPFILGLDDFAGYIPLFSIINVYGFGVGVFLGHMILNIALFIAPQKTVQIVRNPFILLGGSIAFVGIALWGIYEVIQVVLGLVH